MSEERLNEIKDSIELQMQVQQAVGYKNRYDDLLIEEIDLYNEVINLQQENKQLKEVIEEVRKVINAMIHTGYILENDNSATQFTATDKNSEFGVRAKILLQILDKGESNE